VFPSVNFYWFSSQIGAYSINSSRNISDFLAILNLDMGSQYEMGCFFLLLNVPGGGERGALEMLTNINISWVTNSKIHGVNIEISSK
jgi:hypothetical protein